LNEFVDIVFSVFLSSWGRTCTGNQPTQQHARSRRSAYAPADDSEGTVFVPKVQICVKTGKCFKVSLF